MVGAAVSTYYRYRYQIAQLAAETAALQAAADVNRRNTLAAKAGHDASGEGVR
ncbi:MAG: hypothetical protein R2706_00065 [Acidimicrobiales bacterium]